MFEVGRNYQVIVGGGDRSRTLNGTITDVQDHLVMLRSKEKSYIFSTRSGFVFATILDQ